MSRKGFEQASDMITAILLAKAEELKKSVYEQINKMPLRARIKFALKVLTKRL